MDETVDVKDALTGEDNDLRKVLNWIIAYERGNWHGLEEPDNSLGFGKEKVMELLIGSLE